MNTDEILVTIIGEKFKMYSSIKNELMKKHFCYFFHKCGAIETQKNSNISEVEVLAIPETLA